MKKRKKSKQQKKDSNKNFIFFLLMVLAGSISFVLNEDNYLEDVFLPVVYGFGILIAGLFIFGILPNILGNYKIVRKDDNEE